MRRLVKKLTLPLCALGLMLALTPAARAQYVVYPPRVLAPAVSYSYYPATSFYYPPTTYSYYPATTYSAYAPVATSYYTAPVYPAPFVSYYQPVVTYSAPAAVYAPGAYTTRSYVGYGVFRPRGVYTESYYNPYVAPRTSYYRPIYWR